MLSFINSYQQTNESLKVLVSQIDWTFYKQKCIIINVYRSQQVSLKLPY